ncbi:hypothetical protein [Rhizobium sp. AG855]|nr:hypothetical protein [Rhizobium sp. AG855]
MQDFAAILSDILSYMSADRRSEFRSIRWLVQGVMVASVVGLVWVLLLIS